MVIHRPTHFCFLEIITTTFPEFPISFCVFKGDTGAGKTSLMNALLDHADVLPTSGIRACTAVVVQIVHNSHSDTEYVAEIEFLSESVRWSPNNN